MNVLFLDIDGVLNSMLYCDQQRDKKGHNEIDESKLPLLKRIVDENDALIVLSSTWRDLEGDDNPSCIEMWNYLIDSLAKYGMQIAESTPYVHCNRPLEIKAWLEKYQLLHGESVNWISLDDDFSEKDYEAAGIGGHLIQTKFFVKSFDEGGLLEKHVRIAKEMFDSQKDLMKNPYSKEKYFLIIGATDEKLIT